MEYIERDEIAITAHCAATVNTTDEVRITYLPPQKLPRWARQVTAAPRGTSLGNGHYVRQGVNHA
jgi:hypothetical protein